MPRPLALKSVAGGATARVSIGANVRSAAAAAALLCALSGCATTGSYAGVPLGPGAADPELQSLARRAEAGDKHAQLELGIRYEEGRGVPENLERAKSLYRAASSDGGGSQFAYSPGTAGGRGQWVVFDAGGAGAGLAEASLRLYAIDPASAMRRVSAWVAGGKSEPEVCARLSPSLRFLAGAEITNCAAYAFDVKPQRGPNFTAYDVVAYISPEDAAERDYPTDLVDPPVPTLVPDSRRVQGELAYVPLPTASGTVAVIVDFKSAPAPASRKAVARQAMHAPNTIVTVATVRAARLLSSEGFCTPEPNALCEVYALTLENAHPKPACEFIAVNYWDDNRHRYVSWPETLPDQVGRRWRLRGRLHREPYCFYALVSAR